MKPSVLLSAFSAAAVLASPGAISLKRSFKDIETRTENEPSGTIKAACIECPCDGFSGNCQCILYGCCCDWTVPGQPPATGWKRSPNDEDRWVRDRE